MSDTIFIQHRFTITEGKKSLTDALVMPLTEYQQLTPEQIEAQKQERFTSWKQRIDNPPVVKEPSKEELIASLDKDLASLEEQKTVLTAKKSEIQAKEIGVK